MKKIFVTLDLAKIDKSKITSRSYKKRDGTEVLSREFRIEIIPLKEPVIAFDKGYTKGWKTHFVTDSISKEEMDAGKKATSLGDGIVFENRGESVEDEYNSF